METSTTYTIKTSVSGTPVELRKWITGKQREEINAILMSAMKMKADTMGRGEGEMSEGFAEAFAKSEHKEIEAFVVSVNGQTDNIVEAVLSLPEADTEEVKNEIKKNTPDTE